MYPIPIWIEVGSLTCMSTAKPATQPSWPRAIMPRRWCAERFLFHRMAEILKAWISYQGQVTR